MCLALPMKLIKRDGSRAMGEAGGITREIRLDFLPEAEPGDYVMVHASFAIQRMTEEEALENVKLLEEIRDAL
ncbi:MAG: HypC/HybG/HupF family hydrogenase formation chaperone [Clostridium sp.]|nr:HypC/HybG/HupF family hydrogenase formation chaperone [Clostridium sp.]